MKTNIQIQKLVNNTLKLSPETPVELAPHPDGEPRTDIHVHIDSDSVLQLSVPCLPEDITHSHINNAAEELRSIAAAKHPFLSRIPGFLGWWVIFAGSLSMFSVCPVCGSPVCPVGIGITGIVAGCMALCKQYMKYLVSRVRFMFRRHR